MPAGYVHVLIIIIIVMLINDGDGKHGFMSLENIWASHSWSQIEHIGHIRSPATHFCTVPLGLCLLHLRCLHPYFVQP